MVAYAILFRYADFVTVLGGTELQLGWIVGVGMIGSVLARFSLGKAIDQRGPRLIWLGSLAVLAAVCFAHLGITRSDGPSIYLLRFLYCTAVAGIFGAATTFVTAGLGAIRIAKCVSILGTAGLVGMILGSHAGDLLAGSGPIERRFVDRMFIAAGLLTLAAIPFAWLSTRNARAKAPGPRLPTLAILRVYRPGFVLVIGVAAGAALSLPQTFLRTYAAELSIPTIGMFFTVSGLTAVAIRLLNHRLLSRFELAALMYVGLAALAAAQALFLVVGNQWEMILPGLPYGLGQALLYPLVTAIGTSVFPAPYRGFGVALVLASFDVGQLIASPLAGGIVYVSEAAGVGGYPVLFLATAAMLIAVGAIYWWTLQRRASRGASLGQAGPEAIILSFPGKSVPRHSSAARSRKSSVQTTCRFSHRPRGTTEKVPGPE